MEAETVENKLTDQAFWSNYWESKTDILHEIDANYVFSPLFRKVCESNPINTAIELGGFPGYFSLFLTKYLKKKTTLLDFFILPSIINNLEKFNNLPENSIQFIQGDLFDETERQKFDLVFSCGLIEHFQDTKDIIKRHVDFMAPNSVLLLTLPNFTGVNGWFQRNFDRNNYDKHNINSMNPELLKGIYEELGLEVKEYGYYGKFSIWLENKKEQSAIVKILFKLCWLAGKVFTKIIPVESKLLSPYIFIWGSKR